MQTALERLQDAVGMEVYNQISEVLAGELVYFPKRASKAEQQKRNEQIKEDYYNGMNYRELSRKYGLVISTVSKIVCSK